MRKSNSPLKPMYGYGGDHEKRNRGKVSSDRYDWRSVVSMVVSICHTSALTWAIAATLKLLSTCVDGATRPGRTVSKEKLSFPKAFFPALARPEWRRKFELARGPRQPSRKFLQFYDETYPLSFVLFYPLRHRAEAWSIRKRLQELRNHFRLSNSTTLTQ